MSKYELELISLSKKNKNKAFRQYMVDNMLSIGVEKKEPFAVRFRNNTSQQVQVRVSIDGTDVITGSLASTATNGKMWVVNAFSSLDLKAWPESAHGGAELIFGNDEDGVAHNTHGNKQGRGIIAAAVFVEDQPRYTITYNNYPRWVVDNMYYPVKFTYNNYSTCDNTKHNQALFKNITSCNTGGSQSDWTDATYDTAPAVGAGSYVPQQIHKTSGLTKPKLDEIIQVKYEWWGTLQKRLGPELITRHTPNAFPGDEFIDLKNTPRFGNPRPEATNKGRFV